MLRRRFRRVGWVFVLTHERRAGLRSGRLRGGMPDRDRPPPPRTGACGPGGHCCQNVCCNVRCAVAPGLVRNAGGPRLVRDCRAQSKCAA